MSSGARFVRQRRFAGRPFRVREPPRRARARRKSLYGATTVNGVLVALFGRDRGLPLFESRPKLVFHAWLTKRAAGADFACRRDAPIAQPDAFVSARCASQRFFGEWRVAPYRAAVEKGPVFPAEEAVYPCPEPVSL